MAPVWRLCRIDCFDPRHRIEQGRVRFARPFGAADHLDGLIDPGEQRQAHRRQYGQGDDGFKKGKAEPMPGLACFAMQHVD